MISVYWPKKNVPAWLEDIQVTGNIKPWSAKHGGFGIIAKAHGKFIVWSATGSFIKINGGGGIVSIYGKGGGVVHTTRFKTFIRWICSPVKMKEEVHKVTIDDCKIRD